jgi:Copper type II ascorbate-dependent monooxygenase, C-terminal domain
MKTLRVVALAVSTFLVSCGSSGTSPVGGGGRAATVGAPGGTTTSSGNGATGNGAAGGGVATSTSTAPTAGGMTPPSATGDAAANDPNTATIRMGTFTVPAGQEVFMCQDFDNPFGGVDVAIGTSASDMTEGSHHLHVFYGADSPPSPTVTPCQNPFEFRSLLYGAQQPHYSWTYPAGMAAKLKGSLGLRLQAHYINASSADYQANVVVRLTKVDPSTITKWIAQLYYNRVVLSVAPGDGQVVSTTCTVPSTYGPISLISGVSHMHSRGVHFVASTSTGTSLLNTTAWDEPPTQTYDPPILLNPGDSITWTCTYDNTTGNTLTFGDSAAKNEMCIFLARFYSAPSGNDIECQSPTPDGAGVVSNNIP